MSLAVALCEEVSRVGRIWADGQALDQSGVTSGCIRGRRSNFPIR
ncbi:MAG: hypothetical protein U1E40_06225 [Amaricoccus sp.]